MILLTVVRPSRPSRSPADGDSLDSMTGLLRPVPKVELHAHLSGCVRLSTIADLAKEAGLGFSRAIEKDLSAAVVLREPARSYGWSFAPWKRVIDKVTAIPDNHYRMTYEVAQDMAADGVVHAELRSSVRLPFDRTTFRSMLRGMDEAATAARKDHRIDVRFILGFNRQQFFGLSPAEQTDIAANVLEVTDKYRHLVVGFDTWGNENRRPPRAFSGAFGLIRRNGYPLTIHAGETGNVENIRQAIVDLECRRLGHATAIVQDRELMARARAEGIGVEVCLTSNRLTGALPEIQRHPLAEMVHRGVPVCLCADNTLVYGTTLSREYALAVQSGLLTPREVLDIAEKAWGMAFLPADEQVKLAGRLRLDPQRKASLAGALDGCRRG
jgi:adenosine deaminase